MLPESDFLSAKENINLPVLAQESGTSKMCTTAQCLWRSEQSVRTHTRVRTHFFHFSTDARECSEAHTRNTKVDTTVGERVALLPCTPRRACDFALSSAAVGQIKVAPNV